MLELLCLWLGLACSTPAVPPLETTEAIEPTTPAPIVRYTSTTMPEAAWNYRYLLIGAMQREFGHTQFLSVSGAHMYQEAAWRCDLDSPFAVGCAQFVGSTAKWMGASKCRYLGKVDRRNPEWAYPCAVHYLGFEYKNIEGANTEFDHIAMALRAYNEGGGNLKKARALATDPGDVVSVSAVSWKAAWAEKETDSYWHKILVVRQPEYYNNGYGGVLYAPTY